MMPARLVTPFNACAVLLALSAALIALPACDGHDHHHGHGHGGHDHSGHGHDHAHNHSQELAEIDVEGLAIAIQASAKAGNITVVEYWATWCTPCVALIPPLHNQLHKWGEGVRGISVSIDGREDLQAANDVLVQQEDAIKKQYGFDSHLFENAYILPDPDEQKKVLTRFAQRWTQLAPPAIYIYDRDGKLYREITPDDGNEPDVLLEKITAAVEELRAKGG